MIKRWFSNIKRFLINIYTFFIASTLNVEVEALNPIKNITNSISVDNINQFSTAIGLAIRGLDIE